MVTTYEYDAASQLTKIETKRQDGSVVARFEYTYDAAGNRTSMVELSGTHTYSYDTLDRLIGAQHPQPQNPTESFSYDALGNRTSSHLNGSLSYDAANQLLEEGGFTYTYDANGNLASKTDKATGAVTTYTYNAEDQLVKVTLPDGSVAEYGYDGTGRRIYKKVGGRVTKYVYDQEDILLQYDSGNNLTASWVHGPGIDEPLAVTMSNKTYFYVFDGLGSVVALTDEQGNIVNRYVYDSFGNIVQRQEQIEQPYTYTAREEDKETGLYFYRARYYDARVGRFVSQDPNSMRDRLLFALSLSLKNKKEGGQDQTNGYTYCANAPLTCRDSEGRFAITVGNVIVIIRIIEATAIAGVCVKAWKCMRAIKRALDKALDIRRKYGPFATAEASLALFRSKEYKDLIKSCPKFVVEIYTL